MPRTRPAPASGAPKDPKPQRATHLQWTALSIATQRIESAMVSSANALSRAALACSQPASNSRRSAEIISKHPIERGRRCTDLKISHRRRFHPYMLSFWKSLAARVQMRQCFTSDELTLSLALLHLRQPLAMQSHLRSCSGLLCRCTTGRRGDR